MKAQLEGKIKPCFIGSPKALLYTDGMDGVGARLHQARVKLGLSQKDVAKWAGVTPQAVSNWEREEDSPSLDTLRIIAPKLRVTVDYLIGTPSMRREMEAVPTQKVPVLGYVGAADKLNLYAVSVEGIDEVRAAPGASRATVGVEIRGDSLGKAFNHWVAFYDDLRAPPTEDLFGQLCIVGLEDDSALIKILRPGKKPGTFDLEANDGSRIENVKVQWAAEVKDIGKR